MLSRSTRNLAFASLFALTSLTACGDSAVTPADIAGPYRATLFDTSSGGQKTNQLAAGASITITLVNDLTMSGTLFVPGGDANGMDLTVDLAGTWTLLRNVVLMEQTEDTFLRDIDWQVIPGGSLSGSGTFSGVSVDVVFERT